MHLFDDEKLPKKLPKWRLERCKKHYNLRFHRMDGEAQCVDKDAIMEEMQRIRKIITKFRPAERLRAELYQGLRHGIIPSLSWPVATRTASKIVAYGDWKWKAAECF